MFTDTGVNIMCVCAPCVCACTRVQMCVRAHACTCACVNMCACGVLHAWVYACACACACTGSCVCTLVPREHVRVWCMCMCTLCRYMCVHVCVAAVPGQLRGPGSWDPVTTVGTLGARTWASQAPSPPEGTPAPCREAGPGGGGGGGAEHKMSTEHVVAKKARTCSSTGTRQTDPSTSSTGLPKSRTTRGSE